MKNKKMKFYSIKRNEGVYEGMFITPTMEEAREVAIKNGFTVDDDTVFEDVTVGITEADKIKNKVTHS